MSRNTLQTGTTTLRRIDPDANMRRFYRVMVWPDLFGGFALMREWGRIGQSGRLRVETYPDAGAASAARDRLVARKRRKGYRPAP